MNPEYGFERENFLACTICGASLTAHTDTRPGRTGVPVPGHTIDKPGDRLHGVWHPFSSEPVRPFMPTGGPYVVHLPTDAKARKQHPVGTGVLDYFPLALMAVAHCSQVGNDQHNPGTPLHWDRSKSQDEWDALVRHGMERGKIDTDGVRHSAKMAWRALALLQKEIEAEGQ